MPQLRHIASALGVPCSSFRCVVQWPYSVSVACGYYPGTWRNRFYIQFVNYSVSSWISVALFGRMDVKNELARTWKKTVLVNFAVQNLYLRVRTGVDHEEKWDSMCPGRDSKRTRDERESSVLLHQPAGNEWDVRSQSV